MAEKIIEILMNLNFMLYNYFSLFFPMKHVDDKQENLLLT